MLASLIIASYMTVASGNCCTVSVDFAKSAGPIRPLNGVNNAPCHVGTNDWEKIHAFERAGIPFMRTHDTVGAWGGAHYVDIPNVFPDFDADENDPENYDFTFTDRYLANVVKAGTEIFYRLGVTIENNWRIKRYTTNPPKDFAKWARICEHVVRHYNEGWADGYRWNIRYWEIWNEPDNPSMWSGTMKQFLDLYEVSAKHLKRCFPEIKVGGYGSCGFYGLNHTERSGAAGAEWGFYDDFIKWYDAFLARCRDKAVPLDFFSFHLYTEDPREHKLHSDYAQGKLNEYGFASTELINDEWNAMSLADDWSDKSKGEAVGKETHASAAYIAAVLSVMQRATTLSKAMFYCARPQDGGFGTLFHANKRPTMAFEGLVAFDKLHQLGMSVRVESSCSNVYALAAKDADGRQRVMIANWDNLTREVVLRLDPNASYKVSRIDAHHAKLALTNERVRSGDTLVIFAKGVVLIESEPAGERQEGRRTIERIAYSRASTNCVLDLSVPSEKGFSTLVWLHGGGLQAGHRHHLVGFDLNRYGSAAVEYRLVPEGTYTNCLEDAAAAVAWVIKHITEFGGDPEKVFVGGHSAGGWLTYMVGMDPRWLNAHDCSPERLSGLLPISGQATKHFNVRAFERDKEPRFSPRIDEWAPLRYVREKLPPMLIVTGDPTQDICGRSEENALMAASLRGCGNDMVEFRAIPETDHCSCEKQVAPLAHAFIEKVLMKRKEK